LGRELELHGAPDRLVERCALARTAELRHARALGRLAERHGVLPPAPAVPRIRVRSLVDLALVNIVEGFVRTTYGAAAAQLRARTAEIGIRNVMDEIAGDELVHAELAFDIAVWLQAEIDPVEGVWVEDALRHQVVALARELDVEVAPELCEVAGVPTRREALAIWSNLSKSVWHGLSERVWDASTCTVAA
ncbi:MAG: putative lipoprotein, partial [Labilithrix sp.]|nr:putative lipoprotein [Labilithrix sp.]